MSLSIDVAYIISMTNFDGEIDRLDLFYDGLVPLKGVLGGSAYPLFWLNMGGDNSLAVKEDKLKAQTSCNREDVKEFCDSFYGEYEQFTFRPFIKDDAGRTFSKSPDGYNAYHALLVKNFIEGAIDYSSDDSAIAAEPSTEASAQEIQDLISDVTPRKLPTDKEQ